MTASSVNARVLRVDHASLVVADPEVARHFYETLLGLLPLPRPGLGFPGRWYDLGSGQALHLLGGENPDPASRPVPGGRDRHLALRVQGLEELLRRLEAGGFPAERSRSGRMAAFVRDRDGNTIELLEAD
ncbi:VOC family protein [Thioalkalivibrio sp. ALJ7]|uniref:VOC family protein n=1 Tax=Thioalkalivibrio sp. ALJ7 TaxID=1158756 RepID=UPI00036C6381|nr:VOC family protein [Thioalkalivibrio sp. ALJ7]